MFDRSKYFVVLAALVAPVLARAEPADVDVVDVGSAEIIDVIETTDGSIWKGLVVEQTPGVSFKVVTADGSVHVIKAADVVKLSKQRNKAYRRPVAATPAEPATAASRDNAVGRSYEPTGSHLPAPLATSGMRLGADLAVIFPAGDLKMLDTSFAPNVYAGYEALFGNFGLAGGGLARFTYWPLPKVPNGPDDAAWTLETHLYGRAALHISRVALYTGLSLGLDTNYVYTAATKMASTTTSFGMNLQAGLEIAPIQVMTLKLGVDFHPDTDKISSAGNASVSYVALTAGAALRF